MKREIDVNMWIIISVDPICWVCSKQRHQGAAAAAAAAAARFNSINNKLKFNKTILTRALNTCINIVQLAMIISSI